MSGQMLRVEPVGKPSINTRGSYDSRQNFQPSNNYNQVNNYGNRPERMGGPAVWNVNQPWAHEQNQPMANNAPAFNYQQSAPNPYAQQVPAPHPQGSLNQRELMLQGRGHQECGYQGTPGAVQSKALMSSPAGQHQPSDKPNQRYEDVRKLPQGKPSGLINSPQMIEHGWDDYKDYEKRREMSPDRRSPMGRRMSTCKVSPPSHRMSHDHGMSQHDRMSPSGRRISPSDRRISPSSGRRMSPSNRMVMSSGRRSPTEMRSPLGRMISSSGGRVSPSRRMIPSGGSVLPPTGRGMPLPEGRMSLFERMIPPGGRVSPSGRRMSPPIRRMSPSGIIITPSGRRVSPPGKRMSPSGRRMSPSVRPRMSPSGRRISPSDRRISPSSGRRMSPSNRMVMSSGRRSPTDRRALGRMISSSGKQVSPSRRMIPSGGRVLSPTGRRISSPEREMSPSERMIPPGGRVSPFGRRMSPPVRRISPSRMIITPSGRRVSPPGKRMSPSGRRMSPSARPRMSPSGRRISPSDRRISPSSGRRMSPSNRMVMSSGRRSPTDRRSPLGRMISSSGRQVSPSRRIIPFGGRVLSPTGRRISSPERGMSPSEGMIPPGGRVSPFGRRMSPPVRRISPSRMIITPSGRRVSPPGKRMSPLGRRMSPSARPRMSPSGRRISPSDRRISPSSGRRMSPSNRMVMSSGRRSPTERMSPLRRMISSSGRRVSPPRRIIPSGGRVLSPTGRRISSPERGMSPFEGMISPGGRVSPTGRRMSPPVRRMSPSGMIITPSGRRVSPPSERMLQSGRKMSPSARPVSPSARRISPDERHTLISRRDSPRRSSDGRQMSPSRMQDARYSPSRHHSDKLDKFRKSGRPPIKMDRPAYEPEIKAPKQAMYSGGYHPNVHGTVQFPMAGSHHGDQRNSPWQDRDKTYPNQKKEEDRRDRTQMSRGPDREVEYDELQRGSTRASHSPTRRDRSPLRDRYRRHSPSPRSSHRSWALSPISPEAPPPPIWPGQDLPEDQYARQNRSKFYEKIDKEEKMKNVPPWETPFVREKDEEPRDRRPNIEFDNEIRICRDLGVRDMGPPAERAPSPRRSYKPHENRIPPKFEKEAPNFEHNSFPIERRENFSKPEPESSKYIDKEAPLEKSEHHTNLDNDKMPRHQETWAEAYMKKNANFDKEFEDLYTRALEFSKKRQELGKHDHMREEHAEKDGRRELREEPRRDGHPDGDYKRTPQWADNSSRLHPDIKAKRYKASAELARRIIRRHLYEIESPELTNAIEDSLKETAIQLMFELFGDKDVSFVECTIKFISRFDEQKEDKMFYDAKAKLSSRFRGVKRSAPEATENPTKSARRSPEHNFKLDDHKASASVSNSCKTNFGGETEAKLCFDVPPPVPMSHFPFAGVNLVPIFNPILQEQIYQPNYTQALPPVVNDGAFHLYLCKDDFSAYQEHELQALKTFLGSKMFRATEASKHAPSFTCEGLQTPFRYEMVTEDPESRDWLISVDFSRFKVIVYMNDELLYERVAIWLPGHSKYKKLEPLTKLWLQNQHLKRIEIDKWKFVKKIVTMTGTRLYVDVPPASARALESVKSLSYELQQVNFFLRALAVNKEAFDAGLAEESITVRSLLISAAKKSPMPTLKENEDERTVMITLKSKTLLLVKPRKIDEAYKIKERIIHLLFQYLLQAGGRSKTDFVKFGFIMPCYFGIVPANNESMKWLMTLDMGELNKQPIIVVDNQHKLFEMSAVAPHHCAHKNSEECLQVLIHNIKRSNKCVKGINFGMWKGTRVARGEEKAILKFFIDAESINTLARMNFVLDYMEMGKGSEVRTILFQPAKLSVRELMEKIAKYNSKQADNYVVADMEIAYSPSDSYVAADMEIACSPSDSYVVADMEIAYSPSEDVVFVDEVSDNSD